MYNNNTYNSQCFVHLSGLRAVAETADVNGSPDVSRVDEGNVVVKIRGRLAGYKRLQFRGGCGLGPYFQHTDVYSETCLL